MLCAVMIRQVHLRLCHIFHYWDTDHQRFALVDSPLLEMLDYVQETCRGALYNAAISACATQQLWQKALNLLDASQELPGGAEFRQNPAGFGLGDAVGCGTWLAGHMGATKSKILVPGGCPPLFHRASLSFVWSSLTLELLEQSGA